MDRAGGWIDVAQVEPPLPGLALRLGHPGPGQQLVGNHGAGGGEGLLTRGGRVGLAGGRSDPVEAEAVVALGVRDPFGTAAGIAPQPRCQQEESSQQQRYPRTAH